MQLTASSRLAAASTPARPSRRSTVPTASATPRPGSAAASERRGSRVVAAQAYADALPQTRALEQPAPPAAGNWLQAALGALAALFEPEQRQTTDELPLELAELLAADQAGHAHGWVHSGIAERLVNEPSIASASASDL